MDTITLRMDKITTSMMDAGDQTPVTRSINLLISGYFENVHHGRMGRDDPMDNLMIWVQSGRGYVETEGQRHDVVAGDLILLPAHRAFAHGQVGDAPYRLLWAHFTGDAAAWFMDNLRRDAGPVTHLGLDPRLRALFMDLVMDHAIHARRSTPRHQGLFFAILCSMIDLLDRQPPEGASGLSFDPLGLQHWIHQRLDQPLSLQQLADHVDLSPNHFARLFKSHFNMTPMRYVTEQRMQRAGVLLKETMMTVKAIAAAVGYDDPYYFSRAFKHVMGQPPARWRT